MRMRQAASPLLIGLVGLVGFSVLALAGCSTSHSLKPVSQSVNNLSYDSKADYAPTNNTATPKTAVVAQLVPAPAVNSVSVTPPTPVSTVVTPPAAPTPVSDAASAPVQTPQQVVASQNQAATQVPVKNEFFNASMTYDYQPGAVYTIYCAALNLTDITLGTGEKIISIAAGDTLRWQLSQTYSGSGAGLMQHIVVKPNSPGLNNTLLITTDQRVYHLVLKTVDSSSYMVEVNWHYQADPMMFVSNQAQGYSDTGAASGSTGSPFQLDLAQLDFSYEFGTVTGSKPSWYPTRVFNDGRQTFIEFPADFYNSDLPVLYISTTDKTYGTMVNWRLKGRYMIVDAVLQKARLESGVASKENQTIVQINHT